MYIYIILYNIIKFIYLIKALSAMITSPITGRYNSGRRLQPPLLVTLVGSVDDYLLINASWTGTIHRSGDHAIYRYVLHCRRFTTSLWHRCTTHRRIHRHDRGFTRQWYARSYFNSRYDSSLVELFFLFWIHTWTISWLSVDSKPRVSLCNHAPYWRGALLL